MPSNYDEQGKKLYMLAKNDDSVDMKALLDGLAGNETLRAVVDWENPDDKEFTALMWAANNGSIECVSALLAAGATVDMKAKDGATALIWAAYNGKTECVSALLAAGATVDLKSKYGDTALMRASMHSNMKYVSALLAAGATVDMRNKAGDTALMMAATYGSIECVSALLAAGATVDMMNKKDKVGGTALMKAARNGRIEFVCTLLAAGADVDMKNNNGKTALMWASIFGNIECVSALLAAGATVDMTNNNGETALDIAKTQEIKGLLADPAAAIASYNEKNPKKKRKEEEGLVEAATAAAAMDAALQAGGTAWCRSKFMIVGEGRAGKTAFSNSIIGREFQQTQSTVGISETTVCSVDQHQLAKGETGGFIEIEENNSELASALASVIKRQRMNKEKAKVVKETCQWIIF
jgi:ankyrin repeat protein